MFIYIYIYIHIHSIYAYIILKNKFLKDSYVNIKRQICDKIIHVIVSPFCIIRIQ